MKYLLDTNAGIGLLEENGAIRQRATAIDSREFGLSAIVRFELYFGLRNGTRAEFNIARIDSLPFPTLPFDEEDAAAAGAVRAALKLKGTPIGAYDVLIAGQALA